MKLDEGHRLTDEQLQELEERIREMYDEAAKELQDIIDDYFAKFAVRDKEMQDMLQAGKIDEEAYKQWRLNQIGRGRRFEQLRDKLAERATHANKVAVAYINDTTPGIYTLNRNYAAYEIESVGAGVDFTLYDEATIRRLLVERPDLMPYYPPSLALKRGIDLDYGKKQITARVTRGILMGESNRQIAAGLRERLTNMSVDSAIRAARTATTAAENGGRTASYQQAADRGIEMTREWVAVHDGRTRYNHAMADGQRVGVKEPFTVGGEKLMFPGDGASGASGGNIYNCRCRIKGQIKGHERKRELYPEWLERKMEENPQGTTLEFKKQSRRNADYAQYQEYAKYARKETPNTFAKFQDLKYSNPNEWEKLKATKRQRETIKNAPCETTPKKFSGYFLKEGAQHAKEFFNAGYTGDDVLRLRYDMARQFDMTKVTSRTFTDRQEERLIIYMKLGNGNKTFRTVWQKDTPDSKPRIITAFRESAKDDK